MASSDFLVFAGASGANVVSQSTYASMGALGPGFSTGIAESNQLNKVWRQGSIMAAVLGQFIADITTQNSVDDGTTATLLGNLLTAIQASEFQVDVSGASNAISLTYVPAPIVPLTDGAQYTFRAAHTNTGTTTLSINGSPAHTVLDQTGTALVGGEIVANGMCSVIYSLPLTAFVLQSNSGGFQHGPTASPGDNTTKLATTAFVTAAVPTTLGAQVIANVSSSGAINHQAGSNTVGVSHTGTGTYTVTFGTALPSANYVVLLTINQAGFGISCSVSSQSTSGFTYDTFLSASAAPSNAAVNMAVFY
jgi:hypothetical protein